MQEAYIMHEIVFTTLRILIVVWYSFTHHVWHATVVKTFIDLINLLI